MSKIDGILKIIWLLIGVTMLVWLGIVRVPFEYRHWQRKRAANERVAPPRREPGIIVGQQAEQDRAKGLTRQGLRFGTIIDPITVAKKHTDIHAKLSPDDWLLVPVTLATYAKPQIPRSVSLRNLTIPAPLSYSWQRDGNIPGFARASIYGVNIVFYRRNGSASRLITDKPAWINAVHIPKEGGNQFYVEMADVDSNGDNRIDHRDSSTLWQSNRDGTELTKVWMPSGEVAPTRYYEPLSGDLFGTYTRDTDHDGVITEYDLQIPFRMTIGDTVATPVVSEELVSRLHEIVFGEKGDRND